MGEKSFVYAAFRSVPDYSAGAPPLISVHKTLEGAKRALYPNNNYEFITDGYNLNEWIGPDGFGLIRLMEIKE